MVGILTDPETGDLKVINGSLAVGDTTEQIAECVLMAARGEFKEYPLIGGEIYKLVNGTPHPFWAANVKQMLRTCGVPVERVEIKGNVISIE